MDQEPKQGPLDGARRIPVNASGERPAGSQPKPGYDFRIEQGGSPEVRSTRTAGTRATASAERRSTGKTAKPKSKAREALSWVLSIGLAVAAAFLIRAFVFEIILVDGDSMMPTLLTHERIGIEKITRYTSLPERGDIIIVKYPNMEGTYVKRAIGLPGETIEVKDSTVYVNGVALEEDYVSAEPYADMAPVVVPEGHVFVMGDNRAHSMDSRASYIGPIAESEIIGHGLFVLWPFDNMHMIND